MMFVGDGVVALGSAIAATDVGVAAGVGVWPEQADKTMRIGTSAQSRSLVIRVLLSFHASVLKPRMALVPHCLCQPLPKSISQLSLGIK